tara:strand:+ start:339 stop:1565 length:1227 start_codon:yes stop_codon:yes gene_type:complete
MKKIKVVELFAGVGGFRLGFEANNNFEVVWSNQWEPITTIQHASDVYVERFGAEGHSNVNIEEVPTKEIPNHNLLCGGFPCQDYSVATTLKNSKGLIGKKGVLWWSIHRILDEMKKPPEILLLENVDRLLVSPSSQKGRDFAVMLKSLDDLGYAVEWRVINAADYGMPQRRRRVFFLGYLKNSKIYKDLASKEMRDWILKEGILGDAFKHTYVGEEETFSLDKGIVSISKSFNKGGKRSKFKNSGVMFNGEVLTFKTKATYRGKNTVLKDIIEPGKVGDEFYIDNKKIKDWEYLKGAKREERTTAAGYKYMYAEGAMVFPDDLNKASRTIITSEGGSSPSRFRHVIQTRHGKRRLTPLELERLNMFPDHFTRINEISDSKRGFLMGNALVVGVVSKIAKSLNKKITNK